MGDPLQIAREMAARDITVYTVGCEPALGYYTFARDFMCTVAEITGGQAIALSSANLLADVIVNGSAEEIALTQLQREVEQELDVVRAEASAASEDLEEEVLVSRAHANLCSRGVTSMQMKYDGGMQHREDSRAIWKSKIKEGASLAACKSTLVESCSAPSAPSMARGRGVRAGSRCELDVEDAYDSFEEEECYRADYCAEESLCEAAEHKSSGGMFGWMGGMFGGAKKASKSKRMPEKRMASRSRSSGACLESACLEAAPAPAMCAPPAAARSASTYVCSEEAVISEAQVARMFSRAKAKSGY